MGVQRHGDLQLDDHTPATTGVRPTKVVLRLEQKGKDLHPGAAEFRAEAADEPIAAAIDSGRSRSGP